MKCLRPENLCPAVFGYLRAYSAFRSGIDSPPDRPTWTPRTNDSQPAPAQRKSGLTAPPVVRQPEAWRDGVVTGQPMFSVNETSYEAQTFALNGGETPRARGGSGVERASRVDRSVADSVADIRSFYAARRPGVIRGVPFHRNGMEHTLRALAHGRITFVGPHALETALRYSPHMRDVPGLSFGAVSVGATCYGPAGSRNDKFTPSGFHYQARGGSSPHLDLTTDRRFDQILVYDDDYSIDGGETWTANLRPTSAAEEQAKLDGARSMIKAAKGAFHGWL